jgi:glycosyltransferase involved in cell wall biosynthesis
MARNAVRGSPRKVALLGNHTPRRCGIATFTADLRLAIADAAPELDCFVLAMNEPRKAHEYPPVVRFEIAESDITSYRRAADFLNFNGVDLLCVQHEYGIFGGKAGAHVLSLLSELRMPIVTTLHTILAEPNPYQRATMDALLKVSARLVVMSAQGSRLLQELHGVSADKIDVIPHGIPAVPAQARDKDQLGVEGKLMMLTFGLLSPDKGIEHVIDALPAIVARFPETIYVVLGATHPHVKEQYGESYRLMLETRAQKLGVDSNLIFLDRFVTQQEIVEFLAAADVYITPYLKPEQSTSGTLAYAVGAGKAVISTPYRYAEELLADGCGILVPFKDPASIARQVMDLFGDDDKRRALGERAREAGRKMLWPEVARSYLTSFQRAEEQDSRRKAVFQAKTLARGAPALPEVNLDHVSMMTDDTGMLQHARFDLPRRSDGYCLDDNARALLLTVSIEDAGLEDRRSVRGLTSRYLAFVADAYNEPLGRFRNFMSYSRTWLEDVGSEDSHGRAVWALGALAARTRERGWQGLGNELFLKALPAVSDFTSPRAWAFSLLGIAEYLAAFRGNAAVESRGVSLAERLFSLYERSHRPDWLWFEDSLTYCNARLSQALIASGNWMAKPAMTSAGLRSLDWLCRIQCSPTGLFAPVGTNGFYSRGGAKSAFDQQPVEACAMISACLEAERVSGEDRWNLPARRAFGWFLGHNQLDQTLYDAGTGGCRDGLHADRPNENQGAESTLSFLLSLVELRSATTAGQVHARALRGVA